MRNFSTILKFEYLGYLRSKTYIIVTCIMLLLALALPCVPTVAGLISNNKSSADIVEESKSAGILDTTGMYTVDVCEKYFNGYTFETGENKVILDRLNRGHFKFVIEIVEDMEFKFYVNKMQLSSISLMSDAESMIKEVKRDSILEEKGFSEEERESFASVKPVGEIVNVRSGGEAAETGESYFKKIGYAYIFLFVLYITLLMYGQYIVISIVSEKSSKAMEILITSAKPLHLMFGKVFGVGAAGLTQFFLMMLVGFLSFAVNSLLWVKIFFEPFNLQAVANSGSLNVNTLAGLDSTMVAFMTPVSGMVFIYLLVFFLLGFFLYAFLFAGFASTSSRIEEANSVAVVPMMLTVAAFLVAMLGLGNPNNPLVVICSYIPFFTPMVMFMRVCTESASNVEALVSIVITSITLFFTGYVSAKVYRMGVLMYGKTLKPMEVIKMFFKARV